MLALSRYRLVSPLVHNRGPRSLTATAIRARCCSITPWNSAAEIGDLPGGGQKPLHDHRAGDGLNIYGPKNPPNPASAVRTIHAMPPIFAASSREASSRTAAIANRRRVRAASFLQDAAAACFASLQRRRSPERRKWQRRSVRGPGAQISRLTPSPKENSQRPRHRFVPFRLFVVTRISVAPFPENSTLDF
jgi:hypothetical protein